MDSSPVVLFSAGAGTGKTTALAKEYLKTAVALWIASKKEGKESGHSRKVVERILAITFTENAAAEMMDKIGRLIRESEDLLLAEQSKKEEEVAASFPFVIGEKTWKMIEERAGKEKSAKEDVLLKFLSELRADLPQAHIQTIHSRCMRLIKENAAQIDMDPDFRVMDEVETGEMLRQVVRMTLLDELEDERMQLLLSPLLLDKGFAAVGGAVQKLYETCRNEGVRFRESPWTATAEEWKVRVWRQVLPEVRQSAERDAENRRKRLSEYEREDLRSVAERLKKEEERFQADPLQWEPLDRSKLRCSERIEEELPPPNYHEMLFQLAQLMQEIERRFLERKKAEGVCDYGDQLSFALSLLQRSPHLKQDLQEQYVKIFVDESQDLNPIQFEIIKQLCGEDQKGLLWERLFLVGDHKQSIYAFRGADVGLFQSMAEEIPSENIARLNRNYRSVPSLLRFVNAFFHWWGEETSEREKSNRFFFEAGTEKGDELVPDREEKEQLGVYWFGTDWEGDAATLRAMEADRIAQLICELRDGGKRFPRFSLQEIAILFRARSHTKIYEQSLARLNIPYAIVGGTGFYQRQEILDLSHALRTILFLEDPLSLLGFLRSPFAGLSDEAIFALATRGFQNSESNLNQEFLQGEFSSSLTHANDQSELEQVEETRKIVLHLHRCWQQLSITELLNTLVDQTAYLPRLLATEGGKQKVANICKLIEMARIYERREHATAHDFLLYLERIIQDPPCEAEAPIEAEGVQLMTIHQAKGKEFQVVFVADLIGGVTTLQGPLYYHKKYGLAIQHRIGRESTKLGSSSWAKYIKDKIADAEAEERKRLLYVAMTRARDLLFLCVPTLKRASKKIWSRVLHAFVSERQNTAPLFQLLSISDEDPSSTPHTSPSSDEDPLTPKQEADLKEKLYDRLSPKLVGLREAQLSISRLIDGFFCWRKFFYTTFLNLDEFESTPRAEGSPLLFPSNEGTIAHQILAQMDFTQPLEENKQFLKNTLQAEPTLTQEEKNTMKEALCTFLRSPFTEQLRRAHTLWQEMPFQAFFSVGEKPSFRFHLTGSIDLLFFEKSDLATVIEYKYARFHPQRQHDYNLQLALYTHITQQAFSDITVASAFLFLKESEEKMFYKPSLALTDIATKIEAKLSRLSTLLPLPEKEHFPCLASRKECQKIDCKFQTLCWEVKEKVSER